MQLLSSSSKDPWLALLTYSPSAAALLSIIAKSDKFEPHPVSGEVEVDWSSISTRYLRVDEETLQAFVGTEEFGIEMKLLWCVGDTEGGGDGWRIGEVGVIDDEKKTTQLGSASIAEAEALFLKNKSTPTTNTAISPSPINGDSWQHVEEEEDDDDAYWAQYDNTPARTPAVKRSPAPDSMRNDTASGVGAGNQNDEDAYYAQYATVQPAMDNHDPDEAAQNGEVESTLGGEDVTSTIHRDRDESTHAWREEIILEPAVIPGRGVSPPSLSPPHINGNEDLAHPRPTSSNGSHSSGANTIERLERTAEGLDQTENGIRQHIARSTRSLFLLARSAGIDRAEFERVMRREMDMLCMLDDDE